MLQRGGFLGFNNVFRGLKGWRLGKKIANFISGQ